MQVDPPWRLLALWAGRVTRPLQALILLCPSHPGTQDGREALSGRRPTLAARNRFTAELGALIRPERKATPAAACPPARGSAVLHVPLGAAAPRWPLAIRTGLGPGRELVPPSLRSSWEGRGPANTVPDPAPPGTELAERALPPQICSCHPLGAPTGAAGCRALAALRPPRPPWPCSSGSPRGLRSDIAEVSAGPGTAGKAQGSLRRGGLGFWGWGSAGNAGNGPGALTSRRWEGMGRRPDLPAPPGSHTLARASDGGGIITPRGEPRTSWDLLELGDGDTSPYVASVRTELKEQRAKTVRTGRSPASPALASFF